MYNFGGLYIDIDVELYSSIEELLIDNNCIFFKEKFEKDIEYYGPFLLYANNLQTKLHYKIEKI